MHRYVLGLTIDEFFRVPLNTDGYADIWCELKTEKGFLRSDMVRVDQQHGYHFTFPLDQELPKECLLRLYTCRGLQSE